MKTFTEPELEKILDIASELAKEKKLDQDLFKSIYIDALTAFNKDKENSTDYIYETLNPDYTFIEAFQVAQRYKYSAEFRKISDADDSIFRKLYTHRTATIRGMSHKEGTFSVQLQKYEQKGTITGYGYTHGDIDGKLGRWNTVESIILADYDKLTEIMSTIVSDPKTNLPKLTSKVFDWERKLDITQGSTSVNIHSSNLYSRVNNVIILVPGSEPQTIDL